MYAQACGAKGFRVTQPNALRDTVAQALATPGPVIVDVAVNPLEIPTMPHIHAEQGVEVRNRQNARGVWQSVAPSRRVFAPINIAMST